MRIPIGAIKLDVIINDSDSIRPVINEIDVVSKANLVDLLVLQDVCNYALLM